MSNLIVNGNFEKEDFGWTTIGNMFIVTTALARSGSYSAFSGFSLLPASLIQSNISTIKGLTYKLIFYTYPEILPTSQDKISVSINEASYPIKATNINQFNKIKIVFVADINCTSITITTLSPSPRYYDDFVLKSML